MEVYLGKLYLTKNKNNCKKILNLAEILISFNLVESLKIKC